MALVKTDVSEDLSPSTIMVTLMMEVLSTSETSVLTRLTSRNIPEDAIRHSHRRENFTSYINNAILSNTSVCQKSKLGYYKYVYARRFSVLVKGKATLVTSLEEP
jgi:hypothetical protein